MGDEIKVRHINKYIAVSLILVLLISSFSIQAASQPTNDDEKEELGPIKTLLAKFLKAIKPILRFELVTAQAVPTSIEIDYLEQAEVYVGLYDLENEEFQRTENVPAFYLANTISFEAEFPDGNLGGAWIVTFDPPVIDLKGGGEAKSKMTVTLNAPPDATYPIQDTVIKVKMIHTQGAGNLYFPPKGSEYDPLLWFISAAILPPKFGIRYSGTVEINEHEAIIAAKIKRFHALDIEAPSPRKIGPGELVSFPIKVQNLGNYLDSFNFKVTSPHEQLKISAPSVITLQPGETGYTTLDVAASPTFYDVGTLYGIDIEVYSNYEPDTVLAESTAILSTQGIYISEMNGIYILLVVAILIILSGLFVLFRRKRRTTPKLLGKNSRNEKVLKKFQFIVWKSKQMFVNQKRKIQKSLVQLKGKSYKIDKEIRETNGLQKALIKVRREQEKQEKIS